MAEETGGAREADAAATRLRRRRRMERIAGEARSLPTQALRSVDRGGMRLLQALHAAELARAAEAYAAAAGGVPRPMHADWVWRPAPWAEAIEHPVLSAPADGTALAAGIKLCHDAQGSAASGRPEAHVFVQKRAATGAPAPFAIEIDCSGLPGASFVSLALGLPRAAMDALGRRHVIALHAVISACSPVTAFARLNMRSGPNCPQIVRRLRPPPDGGPFLCEFDLNGSFPSVRGVDEIWCDLILARPGNARVQLADVSLARRPRARF